MSVGSGELRRPSGVKMRHLPPSQMVFPARTHDRLKYLFWRMYSPAHPILRDAALALGLIRHVGRNDFLIGHVSPGQTTHEFISDCVKKGYKKHLIAWREEGELVSLRRVCGFQYQYHLRVFEDGEVRGHYEFTPECHPFLHLKGVGIEDRRDVFYADMIGKIAIPSPIPQALSEKKDPQDTEVALSGSPRTLVDQKG